MDSKKKEFYVNDLSIASYLKNHGSKMIRIKNGKYVFEFDETIDKNLDEYFKMYEKSMF